MAIKAVIFDMDGTLVDVTYDWQRIRTELETGEQTILAHLDSLIEPERSVKWNKLEQFEQEATRKARLKQGVTEILDYLRLNGIKKALVTNNTYKNVRFLLKKFDLNFDCIITRESGRWKPSGRPFMTVMEELDLKPGECCVVGDSHFDIQAASEANIEHVFILSKNGEEFYSTQVQICESIHEVQKGIERLARSSRPAEVSD